MFNIIILVVLGLATASVMSFVSLPRSEMNETGLEQTTAQRRLFSFATNFVKTFGGSFVNLATNAGAITKTFGGFVTKAKDIGGSIVRVATQSGKQIKNWISTVDVNKINDGLNAYKDMKETFENAVSPKRKGTKPYVNTCKNANSPERKGFRPAVNRNKIFESFIRKVLRPVRDAKKRDGSLVDTVSGKVSDFETKSGSPVGIAPRTAGYENNMAGDSPKIFAASDLLQNA